MKHGKRYQGYRKNMRKWNAYGSWLNDVCPSCKKEWNRIENPNSEEYICEECRLIGMG
ncbi:MAG: hypothetical protein K2J90_02170 [Lachnospiraceae bacterium]|nr:hypothetical protein [Lachnospiraceae bacterium]